MRRRPAHLLCATKPRGDRWCPNRQRELIPQALDFILLLLAYLLLVVVVVVDILLPLVHTMWEGQRLGPKGVGTEEIGFSCGALTSTTSRGSSGGGEGQGLVCPQLVPEGRVGFFILTTTTSTTTTGGVGQVGGRCPPPITTGAIAGL